MSDRVDLREFIGGFVAEAEELVAAAHALLVDIEAAEASGTVKPRAVSDLFRALHTIKGLAGMVSLDPIVDLAHALETVVRAADRGGGRLRRPAIELALRTVQAIVERVRAVAAGRPPEDAPEELLGALADVDTTAEPPPPAPPIAPEWEARLSPGERQQLAAQLAAGAPVWSLTFVPSEANAARGVNIAAVRARLGELGELIKVVPRSLTGERRGIAFDLLVASRAPTAALAEAAAALAADVVPIAVPPAAPAAPTLAAAAPAPELPPPADGPEPLAPMGRAVVRVDLARLDELQEQLSQLIVSRFRLVREIARLTEQGHDVRGLREIADLQLRQLRDLRRAILRVRMVRVSEVLEPLALLLRSLTRPGVKEVRLELDARDAEIDKAVADRMLPALIHLVRNAVDHGLEPIEQRAARGKDRAGVLRVTCRELGGSQLELIIADDGRGIDRAAVAARAGRPIADDAELLDVLATPGFSTRDVATQTSGRGLGMDIVRRIVVTELGGALSLTTTPGAGTTFHMRVPLTIAIIDVFTFECGPQAFVVPVAAVEEIFEIERGARIAPPAPGAGGAAVTLLERRGHAVPVVSLGALLALEGQPRGVGTRAKRGLGHPRDEAADERSEEPARGDDPGREARKAIVIRHNGGLLAFAVDKMLGRQEVVVRQIADPLGQAPGVAGATDLGDGRPTVVLDLFELGARVDARARRA